MTFPPYICFCLSLLVLFLKSFISSFHSKHPFILGLWSPSLPPSSFRVSTKPLSMFFKYGLHASLPTAQRIAFSLLTYAMCNATTFFSHETLNRTSEVIPTLPPDKRSRLPEVGCCALQQLFYLPLFTSCWSYLYFYNNKIQQITPSVFSDPICSRWCHGATYLEVAQPPLIGIFVTSSSNPTESRLPEFFLGMRHSSTWTQLVLMTKWWRHWPRRLTWCAPDVGSWQCLTLSHPRCGRSWNPRLSRWAGTKPRFIFTRR